MIKVYLMIPAICVPEGSSIQDIIKTMKERTNCDEILVHSIKEIENKDEGQKNSSQKLGIEFVDLKVNLSQLKEMAKRIKQLEGQNRNLLKNISEVYENTYAINKKLRVDQEDREEEETENEQISSLCQQIKVLTREKIQNTQTIQKYDAYCNQLLKIIEKNDISVI